MTKTFHTKLNKDLISTQFKINYLTQKKRKCQRGWNLTAPPRLAYIYKNTLTFNNISKIPLGFLFPSHIYIHIIPNFIPHAKDLV